MGLMPHGGHQNDAHERGTSQKQSSNVNKLVSTKTKTNGLQTFTYISKEIKRHTNGNQTNENKGEETL